MPETARIDTGDDIIVCEDVKKWYDEHCGPNMVKKQGEDILHYLGGAVPLPAVGSASRGVLDWSRRYKPILCPKRFLLKTGTS